MNRILRRVATTTLVSLALFGASAPAWAQDAPPRPLPPPPPPPLSAQAPNGEYATPLQQQTQQTYVPQSVAFSGPRQIKDWNEGEPIPPGYHPVQRLRTGLVVGGAVMFGVLYLFSALAASISSDTNQGNGFDNALWIPGIGPFIQMASTSSATGNLVLAIDGAAQSAGLAMLIYGIVSPKTVLLRNDLATTPLVLPIRVGNDGYGVGLVGHF
jgi:hypothetical protein